MITGFIELVTPDAWVVAGHILLVNQADIQGEFEVGGVVTMHAYPTPISIWDASIVEPAQIVGLNPGEAVIEGLVDGVDGNTIFVGGQSYKRASSPEMDVNPLQAAVGMPVRMRTSSTRSGWEVNAVTAAWVGAQLDIADASFVLTLPLVLVNGQQAADIAAAMFPNSRVTSMELVPTAAGGTTWRIETNAGAALDISSTDGTVESVTILEVPRNNNNGSDVFGPPANPPNNSNPNPPANPPDNSNPNPPANPPDNSNPNPPTSMPPMATAVPPVSMPPTSPPNPPANVPNNDDNDDDDDDDGGGDDDDD
ncbi:MAG: hypothetical protein KME04_20865 [Pleurocapsa minor GSE-CHR-MK-17-07R]|nr:hypothetical protein [Pleurocapsa minor GSE-CHR-MK 17-07R]